jgi:hypothetical protein
LILAVPAERWGTGSGQDWLDNHVNNSGLIYLAPIAGITRFALLFALPYSLQRDAPRWLAYPGFAFYSVYLTAIAITTVG